MAEKKRKQTVRRATAAKKKVKYEIAKKSRLPACGRGAVGEEAEADGASKGDWGVYRFAQLVIIPVSLEGRFQSRLRSPDFSTTTILFFLGGFFW